MAVLLAILGASWVQAPRCCYNLPVMARWHRGRASVVNGAGSGRLLASQEIEFQVTWKQMHKNSHISTGLYNACLSYSHSNNSLGWIIHLFQLTSLLFIVSFYRIFHRCVYNSGVFGGTFFDLPNSRKRPRLSLAEPGLGPYCSQRGPTFCRPLSWQRQIEGSS